MRSAILLHLVLFVLLNAGLLVLNLAPVGFDFTRPDVPLWFLWILVPWSLLLLGHALYVAFRREPAVVAAPAASSPEPTRALRATPVDPGQAGLAGSLLADCRREAGQVLSAVGASGGVPVDLGDLLRGAVEEAERLAERLRPLYLARKEGRTGAVEQVGRLEDMLEDLAQALKALRQAILSAAEALAG